MSKTLSNGVMSLKFMQNAQRAKQQAQVELEQAKIKDEAEWEVSKEVKDAWGIGSSSIPRFAPIIKWFMHRFGLIYDRGVVPR